MTRATRALLAAIVVVTLGACGRCRKRDEVKKPDDRALLVPKPFDTLAGGCDEIARLQCAGIEACMPRWFVEELGDEAFCRATVAAHCKVRTSSTASGATVDALRACASEMAHLSCDGWRRPGVREGCDLPPGKIAEGGACAFDEECATRWCKPSYDASFNPVPCGRCRVPKSEGEACELFDCARGLVCGSGRRCERPVESGACADDGGCVPGKTCVAKTCVSDARVGERCDTSGGAPRCDPWESLRCSEKHADGSWSCVEATFVGAGGACGWDGDRKLECTGSTWCRYPPSTPGAGLDPNRKGTCAPYFAIGASCAAEEDRYGCAVPAMCVDGVCRVPSIEACPAPSASAE